MEKKKYFLIGLTPIITVKTRRSISDAIELLLERKEIKEYINDLSFHNCNETEAREIGIELMIYECRF